MKFQSLDPNSDFGARPIIIIEEITTPEDKKGSENMGEFSNTTESQVIPIELNKIDETVIPPIREVDKGSIAYKKLSYAIQENGQLHPITVRRLTEDERKDTDAEFGIIDGHHRFAIVADKHESSILATVIDTPPEEDRKYQDTVMAYRMNESSKQMTSVEKGKVINDLMVSTGKELSEIGEEVFGLKRAMSYRLVSSYKKSVGENTIEKPREMDWNGFIQALDELPRTQEAINPDTRKSQLKAVKTVQQQLRYLARDLARDDNSATKNKPVD